MPSQSPVAKNEGCIDGMEMPRSTLNTPKAAGMPRGYLSTVWPVYVMAYLSTVSDAAQAQPYNTRPLTTWHSPRHRAASAVLPVGPCCRVVSLRARLSDH